MEVMQEVRSQLEIQLQNQNFKLQAYQEPKEVFPMKKFGSCYPHLLRNEAAALSCHY